MVASGSCAPDIATVWSTTRNGTQRIAQAFGLLSILLHGGSVSARLQVLAHLAGSRSALPREGDRLLDH